MAIEEKIKLINYFKELPFYNTCIEKPKIKPLNNIDLLFELPFYEELSGIKQIMHLKDMQCHTKLNQLRKKVH